MIGSLQIYALEKKNQLSSLLQLHNDLHILRNFDEWSEYIYNDWIPTQKFCTKYTNSINLNTTFKSFCYLSKHIHNQNHNYGNRPTTQQLSTPQGRHLTAYMDEGVWRGVHSLQICYPNTMWIDRRQIQGKTLVYNYYISCSWSVFNHNSIKYHFTLLEQTSKTQFSLLFKVNQTFQLQKYSIHQGSTTLHNQPISSKITKYPHARNKNFTQIP